VTSVRFQGQMVEDVRLFWQLPNTYHSTIQPHAHRGQSAKVRRAVTSEYPAEIKRGGQCLRYLPSPDALKRRYRSLKFRMGKYGDTTKPVYVYVGRHKRSQRGVFEINSSGFVLTEPNERLSPKAEQRYLADHGATHTQQAIDYWREETGQKDAKLGHFLKGQ
jgi:hypothetical protein